PLTRRLEPSENQAMRSTWSPAGVVRGWLKPSLIRRRKTEPPNVAKARLLPSGEIAAAVTRFSLTWLVNCVTTGSFGEKIRSRNDGTETTPIETASAAAAAHRVRRDICLAPVALSPENC